MPMHTGRSNSWRAAAARVEIRRYAPALLALVLSACASAPPGGGAGGVFFPPPPAAARIQYLTQFSASTDIAKERGSFNKLVFGDEEVKDELVKPYGVAIARGNIYACDTKRNLITIFALAKRRFGYLGVQGTGKLVKPINVRADERGFIYVADAGRGEVVVFNADDTYAGVLGAGELKRPVDLAIHGNVVYVCDAETCEIVSFDRDTAKLLGRFGGCGTTEGKFARPTNLTTDAAGNLYVSDTINGRVQKVDARGAHLQTFGSLGDRMGQFARPKGVAVDREGRLYVVDAAFENVQIFDPSGRLLLFFAGAGDEPGQLNLPAQVAIDYEHAPYFKRYASDGFTIEYLVIVTSQYGPHKISVYGFGAGAGGK